MALTAAATEALLDEVEAGLASIVGAAMRAYLRAASRRARRAVLDAPEGALVAAVGPLPEDPLSMGELLTLWTGVVVEQITPEVREAFREAYLRSGGTPGGAFEEVAADYVARVSDRLVRGLVPPVYEDSFNKIRQAITTSSVESWSRPQLAQRIAAELSWEDRGEYWRGQKSATDARIDAILEPFGPPGTPARESARLNDPRVQALRADRNLATARLDAEKSYWENRATLIARTESTGVANHAALRALADEGVLNKQWNAARDSRTRDSHALADGQTAALEVPFTVGGALVMVPGDPDAPIRETANCRCYITGAGGEVEDVPEIDDLPEELAAARKLPSAMFDADIDAELSALMESGNFDDPRLQALADEMDRREDPDRRTYLDDQRDEEEERERLGYGIGGKIYRRAAGTGTAEAALRAEYDLWVEAQFVQADAELNGVLLSAEARAAGIDPRDLFTLRRRAPKWASEELQEWFSRHPRMSFAEYRDGKITHTESGEWG